MNTKHFLFGIVLLLAGTLPVSAQVSNDNEDEVYKVASPQAKDYVPGQVLFKLKDGQEAHVRRVAGRVQSAGISSLDKVLTEFDAQDMEQLLPNAKVKGTPRRAKAYNGQTIVERDLTQLYKVTLPEEKAMQTLQLVDELKHLPEVEFAEPNYKMYIMADDHIADSYSTNPMATEQQQWYLYNYGVTQLWDKPIVNPTRPVIAIIDTGVDMTHPDLKDNLWTNTAEAEGEANYDNDGNGFKGDVHGWDFINNTPNIKDFNMHGTHVAGIAAACNNGIGIVGANPLAYIMPVSVLQSDGTGDIATVIKGINYAVSNGATVLNLSLGTYANSLALRNALANAYGYAVIVAAAGNDSRCINTYHNFQHAITPCPMFPAAYSFILGVQATSRNGDLAEFSNYDDDGNVFSGISECLDPDGFNYELRAPGTNIMSTIPGGKYKALQGTSMATPLVSGAISALKMVKQYDSQEILWGDLLHTNNIAEAFAIENRPAELNLVRIQYQIRKDLADETEADYSGDHEIDAGETVSIYPVIRTTFGEASNIKMYLEMGDDFEDPTTVEIYSDSEHKADFGMHLDAYGRGVSLNPLEFKVSNDVADKRYIKIKLVVTCEESTKAYEFPFTVIVANMVKISGLINRDSTLTADHVYYINEDLGVMEGATLTIEPGTRLEFSMGRKLSLWGKIAAKGTPEKKIIFTSRTEEQPWAGIESHQSKGWHEHNDGFYTNADSTLFTLLPTEVTPNKFTGFIKYFYYNPDKESNPEKKFSLGNYLDKYYDLHWDLNHGLDMNEIQWAMTDPDFLTPAALDAIRDWKAYYSQYPSKKTTEATSMSNASISSFRWSTYDNPRDTISYCRIENTTNAISYPPYFKDCVLMPYVGSTTNQIGSWEGIRSNLTQGNIEMRTISTYFRYSNIVNNKGVGSELRYSGLYNNNYFNFNSHVTVLGNKSNVPNVDISSHPSYLGTSREDLVRQYVYEMGHGSGTYGVIDLSNMRTTPVAEAHGIVWKVVVNGKDAQDEYENLAPLGVGKHKFEVYFNRPMNKAVIPYISFGVRDPYTQNGVNEDGSWNEDGTIYTAYKTITGKTKSDGVNRIYVYGAEDNEYFEIPYEKDRFNIQIQAAGSMATGFMAEAGLGRVNLTWDNSQNDFEDAMGFNIYRYTLDADGNEVNNTRINTDIVDIETTEFTDYDVTPGETYYYMYKVLSTDLQEYDVSNVVAATPLTSELGDANGSGIVDVADVITTVNYAAGMEPKPFIFEAADMNTDQLIDILDVIGIIQKILHPTAAPAMTMNEATAVYTVEDGVLYVESPVALAGVQAQINNTQFSNPNSQFEVAEDLDCFEHTSAWLTDNDYLFLAYNLNGKTLSAGKHALLYIGDADLSTLRLSDMLGRNVEVVAGNTTAIDNMGSKVLLQGGVYNLKGQKVSGKAGDLHKLPKGVYIVNGEKVVK